MWENYSFIQCKTTARMGATVKDFINRDKKIKKRDEIHGG